LPAIASSYSDWPGVGSVAIVGSNAAASSVVSDVPPTRIMNGELELMAWLARPVAKLQPEPKSLLACTIVMLRRAESMNSSLTAL
jgi:hypothetical protein